MMTSHGPSGTLVVNHLRIVVFPDDISGPSGCLQADPLHNAFVAEVVSQEDGFWAAAIACCTPVQNRLTDLEVPAERQRQRSTPWLSHPLQAVPPKRGGWQRWAIERKTWSRTAGWRT